MRLSSSTPCVVILTKKKVELKINEHSPMILPENNLTVIACNNNNIEFSSMSNTMVVHISMEVINDYLLFLNKNLTCVKPWPRQKLPLISCHSRTPEVFGLVSYLNQEEKTTPCEIALNRSLLFTVLSNFLEHSGFIALLMYMLRSSVRDSVCRIIQSDIKHYWSLRQIASILCLSPSLLKKKLKNENTSYSQIITECRMRYASKQLLMDDKNIAQISQMCGYNSTSYFIPVFKSFYGVTPMHYIAEHRQHVMP
ncbi:AraC family transcriptional regulator [Escherichia fergusonii]|nr:AraC family transcriptional regulator [Escherichia fergusonii]EHG7565418.1 AraC family transcriptional regulator [Escherichia fergusonii]